MSFKAVTTRNIFLPPPVWEGAPGFERGLGVADRIYWQSISSVLHTLPAVFIITF